MIKCLQDQTTKKDRLAMAGLDNYWRLVAINGWLNIEKIKPKACVEKYQLIYGF